MSQHKEKSERIYTGLVWGLLVSYRDNALLSYMVRQSFHLCRRTHYFHLKTCASTSRSLNINILKPFYDYNLVYEIWLM